MIRILLVTILVLGIVLPARAEILWLVIGASDSSPTVIAQKSKALVSLSTKGFIVQSRDCGDKKNVFAWVAEALSSDEAAQSVLLRLRETVKDAYVKRCNVKQHTLLAFRVSAIDASISDVPQDAVNWQDEDRVSSIHPLGEGSAIVIVRHFVNEREDPIEGRRERVSVVDTTGRRLTLEESCISPSAFAVQKGGVAFECVREQAGDNLLHNVVVFGVSGVRLAEIKHCRKPQWSNERTVACYAETVGSDGRLKLDMKQIELNLL